MQGNLSLFQSSQNELTPEERSDLKDGYSSANTFANYLLFEAGVNPSTNSVIFSDIDWTLLRPGEMYPDGMTNRVPQTTIEAMATLRAMYGIENIMNSRRGPSDLRVLPPFQLQVLAPNYVIGLNGSVVYKFDYGSDGSPRADFIPELCLSLTEDQRQKTFEDMRGHLEKDSKNSGQLVIYDTLQARETFWNTKYQWDSNNGVPKGIEDLRTTLHGVTDFLPGDIVSLEKFLLDPNNQFSLIIVNQNGQDIRDVIPKAAGKQRSVKRLAEFTMVETNGHGIILPASIGVGDNIKRINKQGEEEMSRDSHLDETGWSLLAKPWGIENPYRGKVATARVPFHLLPSVLGLFSDQLTAMSSRTFQAAHAAAIEPAYRKQ